MENPHRMDPMNAEAEANLSGQIFQVNVCSVFIKIEKWPALNQQSLSTVWDFR